MIFPQAGATQTEKPFALYENLLTAGALTGSAGLATGAAYENVFGPQTYDFWQPTTLAGTWVCTLPTALDMDCIAFAAHNLPATGGSFTVQSSPDLVAAYSDRAVFSAGQIGQGGLSAIGAVFATASVRRLRFFSTSNTVAPQIGIAYAGKRLVFPGDVQAPYVPANEALKVDQATNISLGGHYLGGTIKRQSIAQDVAFSGLARAFVQGDLVPFSTAFRDARPFFFAGSPSYMPADLAYVWRGDGAGELRPAWMQGGAYADVKMTVAGYGA